MQWTQSSVTGGSITEVVHPFLSGRAHGVNEIFPEFLKAGMRISTSKSEVMIPSLKKVASPLQFRNELLAQVEELNYLWVLFTNHAMLERLHFLADSGTFSHLNKWRRNWEDGTLRFSA